MGVNESRLAGGGGMHPLLQDAILERALLDTLREMGEEGSGGRSSEMLEHAWDPEDCSPRFRILRDRLTARRLPSPLTTDCIRGKKGYRGGRHVWEIIWERDERGSHAVVGVATPRAPLQALGFVPLVGMSEQSWGWDLVTKKLMHGGKDLGTYPVQIPGFVVPDNIHVVLDMDEKTLGFATQNRFLGVAFRNLPQSLPPLLDLPMCPIISAVYGNCDIKMKYMGRADDFVRQLSPIRVEPIPTRPPVRPSSAGPRSPTGAKPQESVSTQPFEASATYSFHRRNCGENIVTKHKGKTAQRMNAFNTFVNGVVLTEKPLQENQMFEIRLENKVTRWMGGIVIGATSNSPDKFNLPETMSMCRKGTSNFVWSSNKILHNGKEMTTLKINLDELSVGDRIGVMRMADDSLHFYHNGADVGRKVKTLPPVLYGVVDIYGTAEQVSITGGTVETQSSNEERTAESDVTDSVPVFVRMSNTVNLLKQPNVSDIKILIYKVAKDILEPYMDTPDRSLRQKYGDHLVDIGAVPHLTKLHQRLVDIGIETEHAWAGINVVQTTFWNYSDASMKMAKALGKCGVLQTMMKDLDRYGPRTSKNEKRKYLVTSALNILHNCAKATENRQMFRDIRALERLAPFVKAENMEAAISAVLTLSYITEENKTDLLEVGEIVIAYLLGMLKNALGSENLRGSGDGCSWSALELVMGLGNMAINDHNREILVEKDAFSLLITLMEKGGDMEKECAANALWSLAKTERDKKKVREEPRSVDTLNKLSRSSNQGVQEAAKRVLLAIKTTSVVTQGSGLAPTSKPRQFCKYRDLCKRFKNTLDLHEAYFNPQHDRCFCTECHASRGDKLYYTRGEPAKDYGIPIGWYRFALQVQSRATAQKVFEKWHVAFHGTAADNVSAILDTGDLCIPGDVVRGGRRLREADGHFTDDRKPTGFDTKQIFVSPSIRYSGDNCYSKVKEYEDDTNSKTYNAKVALQLCIRPGSYMVGKQTIGATDEIDPRFSNQEIEWSTKERGSTILYGLLVKLSEATA